MKQFNIDKLSRKFDWRIQQRRRQCVRGFDNFTVEQGMKRMR